MSCLLVTAGDWAQCSSRSLQDLFFYVIQHQKKILFSLSNFFLAFWLFCILTLSPVPAVRMTFLLEHLSVDTKEQPAPSFSLRTVCNTTCSRCADPLWVFFPSVAHWNLHSVAMGVYCEGPWMVRMTCKLEEKMARRLLPQITASANWQSSQEPNKPWSLN